uniref:hypothetical protein n=1 Tax=Chlorobotrys sp. TaxID=2859677 RepID=UPI0021821A43|nr:hypothetical protein N4K87_pgp085 [Chlorobotrys sp.]UVI60832.1 hypothetical protein [Chlorobotrys sp.]
MKISNYKQFDLTYCSNIHPGDSWTEIFRNLKANIPILKARLSPTEPFGIGLRLSNKASDELLYNENINIFKTWLTQNNCYVLTINGFVYGDFYNSSIKEKVYEPDWNTRERADFNLNLINILSKLCVPGKEIGFSTSPLGYKFSLVLSHDDPKDLFKNSFNLYLLELVQKMIDIFEKEGKIIHIDFEPEADCFLETIEDIILFFNKTIFQDTATLLSQRLKIPLAKSRDYLTRHVRICYDICHQAVQFENHVKNFVNLSQLGIKIGKIQISSALQLKIKQKDKIILTNEINKFKDNIYLHQVVVKTVDGSLKKYRDLPEAINNMTTNTLWRVHFHLPIFAQNYNKLLSTREDIQDVINFIKKSPITSCLEIETYTWEVLPEDLKLDLLSSIIREYEWVITQFHY